MLENLTVVLVVLQGRESAFRLFVGMADFHFHWLIRCLSLLPRGGGVLPYKGLMGTCGQPGYVFRDFCLKQGIEFIIFNSWVRASVPRVIAGTEICK